MLGLFAPSWVKYALYGAVALGLAVYILVLKLENSHLETVIARQKGDIALLVDRVKAANAATEQCAQVNRDNQTALDDMQRDHRKSIAALSAELARLRDEKQKVKVVKEIIREKAKECVGVPPSIGSAVEWLRANPSRSR